MRDYQIRIALLPLAALCLCAQNEPASMRGTWRDAANRPVASAAVVMVRDSVVLKHTETGLDGGFEFADIRPGAYRVRAGSRELELSFAPGERRSGVLRDTGSALVWEPAAATEGTGGEQLSSQQVSAMPLNKRDFSQLLLLAAGTQTDANGAANFTQQFTVNGQRGAATVFAIDNGDTTDAEMGGATFSNFNVDAIQEIQSSSGVMPAEIGHGAAGFTHVMTKPGTNDLHGSLFEFVRNAAFDARNFFDRQSAAQPERIPPFARNEFGFTFGGPVRRKRTFFFGQYQGFRQVLGTTQVLSVPTAAERAGRDTTAFPGDELIVPVNSQVAALMARYPMPNDPGGPYGDRTYSISSKVRTVSDQFSVRLDHEFSKNRRIYGRFNFNNIDGPITNPNQTAIDASYAIAYFDHQRSAALTHVWTPSPNITAETVFGYVRSTPNFPTLNHTLPGMAFADALFEPLNSASGSIIAAFGNLFQVRQSIAWKRGAHDLKAGVEVRVNRDTTLFGTNPNGTYLFGGGAAYAPVAIRSRSGLHNVQPGDLLPDSLSGFLTATPFSYTLTAASSLFPQGAHMGAAAVRRESYNFYVQDTWKVSNRLQLSYGLRYEVSSRIKEGRKQSSGILFEDASGSPVSAYSPQARARFVVNPQPYYRLDWGGFGPRLAFDWKLNDKTVFRAGASITTILINLWQNNLVTGGLPYVVTIQPTATKANPIPFSSTVTTVAVPNAYTPDGKLVFASGRSTDVAPNTPMDVMRFERELAAASSDKQIHLMPGASMSPDFSNGYIASYTAGFDRDVSDIKISAAYVATAGIKLTRIDFPNGYVGAGPSVARFTNFEAAGATGWGQIIQMSNRSHSTYHSLQASAAKNSLRGGLGLSASYTFSKSIDDTSAVLGGVLGGTGTTILQTSPQNPFDLRGERGPSTFDATHVLALSAIQELPFERLTQRARRLTSGWQLIGMAAFMTGTPFSVFSGLQQTETGTNNADRPDLVRRPVLSTTRTIREDYFGLGADNASLFSIPRGRFGTLGRNTFRGPAFHNFDVSAIKNTPIGWGAAPERVILQFRAEFFNVLNLVNFSLPSNIVLGPGFGIISKTSGPSRQIQLSMKILF